MLKTLVDRLLTTVPALIGVVLAFLNLLNGYSLASGLIRAPAVTRRDIRQLFGMLLLLNAALAAGHHVIGLSYRSARRSERCARATRATCRRASPS